MIVYNLKFFIIRRKILLDDRSIECLPENDDFKIFKYI